MYQEDFILRMARQFAQSLLRLTGLIDDGKYIEARGEIEQGYQALLGLSSAAVYYLPENELADIATIGNELDVDRFGLVARYLAAEGTLDLASGEQEIGLNRQLKALNLLLILTDRAPQQRATQLELITKLHERLAPHGLPAHTLASLGLYFERCGDLERALSVFQAHAAQRPGPAENNPELQEFLKRQPHLPSPPAASGLPGDEIGE